MRCLIFTNKSGGEGDDEGKRTSEEYEGPVAGVHSPQVSQGMTSSRILLKW